MKLGWFTPAWKSENQEKRAKALGRMDDEKLLEILRDKSDDTLMHKIQQEAVDCLSPAGLKEFVLDTSINGWLRGEAVKQIDDEDILFACAKGVGASLCGGAHAYKGAACGPRHDDETLYGVL